METALTPPPARAAAAAGAPVASRPTGLLRSQVAAGEVPCPLLGVRVQPSARLVRHDDGRLDSRRHGHQGGWDARARDPPPRAARDPTPGRPRTHPRSLSFQNDYDNFDGFVVLHGTDTLAYTASALSFMTEHLGKPIILTGSQVRSGWGVEGMFRRAKAAKGSPWTLTPKRGLPLRGTRSPPFGFRRPPDPNTEGGPPLTPDPDPVPDPAVRDEERRQGQLHRLRHHRRQLLHPGSVGLLQ